MGEVQRGGQRECVENPGLEDRRRHAAQRVVRPEFVVVAEPVVGGLLHFADAVEQPDVEGFLREAAVDVEFSEPR